MAYTKYSLTPSSNTAAPPDGAPEGMLPSAVNDTMRDMMAQIRDCGDGIRDGTYTMTAPKITGGTITGVAFTGNTFTSPVISGGSINNTPIGATTANTGAFTTLSATGVTTVQAGTVSLPAITTSGDTNTGIFFPAADTIAFTEGGVESMRIDSSGQVGIGTTSPNGVGKLAVKTSSTSETAGLAVISSANDSFLTIYNSGSVHNIGATYSSTGSYQPIAFVTSGSERMRIDSSGNVGIGTSSPSAKLNVIGGNIRLDNNQGLEWAGSNNYIYGNETTDFIVIATNGNEAMRILSGGNVCIGTTSNIARLGVLFDGNADNGCILRTSTNASGAGFLYFQQDTNTCGSVTRIGTTSAVTYSSTSDYRLKENVMPMTDGLNKVSRLKPVTYTWKQGGESAEGFIAHELAEVCPDAVVGTKDQVETYLDEDGNEQTRPKYQSIDTSFLVATLTAAIQELNAKVEAQAVRIAELESK